jgi:hypothetical protein
MSLVENFKTFGQHKWASDFCQMYILFQNWKQRRTINPQTRLLIQVEALGKQKVTSNMPRVKVGEFY